jgi:tetratricopeptide (TPR) repeat protein
MKRHILLLISLTVAAVFTQGFQCSSSQLTVAKKAMAAKDYAKAKDALRATLQTTPTPCDAYAMLGDAHDSLNEQDSMLLAYRAALACNTLNPRLRDAITVSLYNKYAAAYNLGIAKYNAFAQSQSIDSLKASRSALINAVTVRPDYTEPLMLLGEVNERMGDTAQAVTVYTQWWEAERPGYEAIATKNIAMGSARGTVIKSLGTPLSTKMDSVEGGVLYRDAFTLNGKQVIFSSFAEGANEALIEGWTYDPAPTLTEAEKWRARMANVQPLKNLAYIAYGMGKYEEALKWANAVMRAKPSDQELSALRAQSLQLSGKADEASEELKAQIQKDPSNVSARVQYATMLSGAEKYEEAIAQYKEVIRLDPKNEIALFDYGASCKNLASIRQRAELEKQDNNKKYVVDSTAYLPLLADAASSFEQLRKVSAKYRNDYIVISEIANVYEVRKELGKVKALIMELEALEEVYSKDKEYYRTMEGLYGRNKMLDKMKQASEKGSKL